MLLAKKNNVLPLYLDTVSNLQTLIAFPSITPNEAGSLRWLADELKAMQFEVCINETKGVSNLIAKRHFGEGPVFAFSGHVDVVPANKNGWITDPFSGEIINGNIYGRGAADMKGGIAAMLSATHLLCQQAQHCKGTLYWLITSDEEGEAEHGSKLIEQQLQQEGVILDACLVGEPTSDKVVGDTIKNGRRGALSARVKITGKAGHVAYPENTLNAAHIAGKVVSQLTELLWQKDEPGSKTTLQVTGITVPNIVDNLVPSYCEITFNVRYGHGYTGSDIKQVIEATLNDYKNECEFIWERPCEPYYTGQKSEHCLINIVEQAIADQLGSFPAISTSGGTSDGRFFANQHTQVVECGVRNHTIHQVNEHVLIHDLEKIENIYHAVLNKFFIK